MPILGWVLLLGGLFMVAAARFGWYESGILRDLDWFDQVPMIGRVGGGRRRGFYMLGVFAVALGTFLLFWGR